MNAITENDLLQIEKVMEPEDFEQVRLAYRTGRRVEGFPTRAFREVCRMLALPCRWVDLRHGGARAELSQGALGEDVARRLGHKSK